MTELASARAQGSIPFAMTTSRVAWPPPVTPDGARGVGRTDAKATSFSVTPLRANGPRIPRLLHGVGTRSAARFIVRGASVAAELATAAILDFVWPPRMPEPVVEQGRAMPVGASLALFLHWSPDGRVSAMVRRQLALWAEQGFTIVFISNAKVPPADRDAVAEHAALLILRGNGGRDFGAWRDAFRIATRRFGLPRELLLANDSVLGPIRPLAPIVVAWRGAGEGLFGMTESVAPRPHLQSYLLFAAGERAIASVARHLLGFHDSRSKWRIVRTGEIALSGRMLAEGVNCGAVIDYSAACRAIDSVTRRELGPRFVNEAGARHWPLNPTVHLWRPLVAQLGFPYLKRDVLRAMPDVLGPSAMWRPLASDRDATLIVDHLRIMGVR